jgi:hypothetical protein
LLCLICLTCQESEQHLQLTSTQLSRDVGGQISFDEASRWTNRYGQNLRLKELSDDFMISQQQLQSLITVDCDGLFFYHGLDGEQDHIVCVPVKNNLLLWNTIVTDANTSSTITTELGKQWYENYKSKNLGGTWGYFFGTAVFDEILADKFLEKISLVPAINDENLEVLIVYSWDKNLEGSRSKDQATGAYNHSFLCPSNCPSNL